jgi:acetyltransferase-like isoleucine patch superfamily enzyme
MGNKNAIEIGTDCMFADDIDLWNTDAHPIKDLNDKVINPSKPITIGNNVWVGKNTTILKGVNIEDGVVVGINSTITKDLPSNTVCVGNPAKPIKEDIHWERSFIAE